MAPRSAILLVAFGTSDLEALRAFDRIDNQVRETFPGVEVRWAFTSGIIRSKLAALGQQQDSPEVALGRLMEARYTHAAVLSLHVIPGREFHDLYGNVKHFARMAGGFEKVEVAMPLLASRDDMVRAGKAVLGRIPGERRPADAVVFIGHGTRNHPADSMYASMNHVLQELDDNAYMGTIDGFPGIDHLVPKLVGRKVNKAWLIPFMTIAGGHARKDMAGDKPESWKSVLDRNGIETIPVLAGLAENPEIVQVWIDHLREAHSKL